MRVGVAAACLLLLLFTAEESIAQKRRAVGHPEPPRTSGERIQKALESGTIDEATAIMYKAFAAFGDCRLPAEYRGDYPETSDAIVIEVAAALPSLPPDKRAIVEPFLLRPDDPRSWYAQRKSICPSAASLDEPQADTFEHLVTPDGKVEIHFEAGNESDRMLAHLLAIEISGTIWPALTELMQRQPPTIPLPLLLVNVPEMVPGYAFRQPPCGEPAKGVFIVINASSDLFDDWQAISCPPNFIERFFGIRHCDSDYVKFVVAHELMHAFSYAYDYEICDDRWALEATADWAAGHIYPSDIEHVRMPEFLNHLPERQRMFQGHRAYGANLFFLFLEKRQNDPDVVRRFFAAAENEHNPLLAINTAIGEGDDGFTRAWHDFALQAINEEPYTRFQRWDGIELKAKRVTYEPGADVEQQFEPHDPLLPIPVFFGASIQYHHFTFDERHRAVAFIDGISAKAKYAEIEIDPSEDGITGGVETAAYALEPQPPDEKIKVRTLVRRREGGFWEEVKSPEAFRTFCLDKDEERITEMLIVVSNAHVEANSALFFGEGELLPLVRTSDIGCDQWTGEATLEIKFYLIVSIEYQSHAREVTWHRNDNGALIIRTDAEEAPNTKYVWGYRYTPTGTVSATGTAGVPGFFNCTNVMNGEAPVDPSKSSLSTFNFAPPASAYARGYEGWGESFGIPATSRGPNCPAPEPAAVYWMDVIDGTRNKVNAGGEITGTEDVRSPLTTNIEWWSFSPKPR